MRRPKTQTEVLEQQERFNQLLKCSNLPKMAAIYLKVSTLIWGNYEYNRGVQARQKTLIRRILKRANVNPTMSPTRPGYKKQSYSRILEGILFRSFIYSACGVTA